MTNRPLLQLPMSLGGPDALTDRLLAALAGGPAIEPLPPDSPCRTTVLDPHDDDDSDPTAIVLATSGSTGEAKKVLLSAAALRASADATRRRLGGPGGWLLALPTWHIAGLQVLLRAASDNSPVVSIDRKTPFTATGFVAAARLLQSTRRYVSLVPTQLHRVLADPAAAAELATFDAVLVGGAATSSALQATARAAGIRIVTTYGMSETCGGCVYDGTPLDGVSVEVDHQSGRISLSGPMVARGYRGQPDHPAFARPGTFVTDDLGRLDGGLLTVIGRADEVIVSGGFKVPPTEVERALSTIAGVGEVLVVGVPDAEWGQRVVALVTGAVPSSSAVATACAGLPTHYRPREWVAVSAIPTRGPGKPDRAAAVALAARPPI